jgi:hypothetical protein
MSKSDLKQLIDAYAAGELDEDEFVREAVAVYRGAPERGDPASPEAVAGDPTDTNDTNTTIELHGYGAAKKVPVEVRMRIVREWLAQE